jgi:hypothetical protein
MKAGDRVKTDRRDALMLAKLHRAGELTAIWIPAAHEAMRDLVRARATAVRVLAKARQHLQSFLLRHERIYHGARAWTLACRRWLTTVRFEHPAQQIVLQDYIHAVMKQDVRVQFERVGLAVGRHRPGLRQIADDLRVVGRIEFEQGRIMRRHRMQMLPWQS